MAPRNTYCRVLPVLPTAAFTSYIPSTSYRYSSSGARIVQVECLGHVPRSIRCVWNRSARMEFAGVGITEDHSQYLRYTQKPVYLPIFVITGDHS